MQLVGRDGSVAVVVDLVENALQVSPIVPAGKPTDTVRRLVFR